MAGAWIFFTTFIALFITATAQITFIPEKCIKATCSPGGPGEACNRWKCNDVNGTCMRKEDCIINPGGCFTKGKRNWCKHYKKCKCALPDVCTPRCNTENGMCMFRECKCDPGWRGETCDEFYCDPECVNGNCTGPNVCTCDPGWRGPACNESYCDPDCQNGGTCIGPNECECTGEWTGPICETSTVVCENRGRCNNVNGICYHNTNPILQNRTLCPNTTGGKRWCDPRGDCVCCYE